MLKYVPISIMVFILALGACSSTAEADRTMSRTDLIKTINAHRGKVIVINFFASWCPPCKEEIPDLMETRKHYSADDVLILGLSLDDTYHDFERFSQSVGFNYEVFHSGSDTAMAFNIGAIPAMVMYDRQGRQAFRYEGLLTARQMRSAIDALIER